MRFKRLAVCAAAFLLSSCNWLSEPKSSKSLSSIGGADSLDCLKDVPDQINDYLAGNAQDDSAVARPWDCASRSLGFFATMTRGEGDGTYSAASLQLFLNHYFTVNHQVSGNLMRLVMRLKTAILGGADDHLTQGEIERTQVLLAVLKAQATAVKGLMPFTAEHFGALSQSGLARLSPAVLGAASQIGSFVASGGKPYALGDVAELAAELQAFLSAPGAASQWLRELLPVGKTLKAMLVGGSGETLVAGEWPSLLANAARFLNAFLTYTVEEKTVGGQWLTAPGLDALEKIVDSVLDITASRGPSNDVIAPGLALELLAQLRSLSGQQGLASARAVRQLADAAAKLLLAKQVVLGGTPYEIRMSSLSKIRPTLGALKGPVLTLYDGLVRDNLAGLERAEFERRVAELAPAADALASVLETLRAIENTRESLQGLSRMVTDLAPQLANPDLARALRDGIGLAPAAKGLLAGAPADSAGPGEWSLAAQGAARFFRPYFLAQRSPEGDGSPGTEDQRKLAHLWETADATANALGLVAGGRPDTGAVAAEEIVALLDALPASLANKLFPDAAQLAALRASLPGLFSLKAAVAGGSRSGAAPGDLSALRSVLKTLKDQAWKLAPYRSVMISEIPSWSVARLEELAQLLLGAGTSLGDAFSRSDTEDYDLRELSSLALAVAPLLGDDSAHAVADLIPVVSALKGVLVRPPAGVLLRSDWALAPKVAADWVVAALRDYHFFMQPEDWDHGSRLDRLLALVESTLRDLNLAAARALNGTIDFRSFDLAIDSSLSWAAKKGIRIDLTAPTIKGFLRPFVRRYLGGSVQGSAGRGASGLTLTHVANVWRHFREWSAEQQILIEAYRDLAGNRIPDPFHDDGFPREPLAAWFDAAAARAMRNPEPRAGAADLATVVRTFRPLFLGTDSVISYLYDGYRESLYSFDFLSRMNLYSRLLRILIDGYSEDPARARAGTLVTKSEFTRFIQDSDVFLKELKQADPRETAKQLADKRFFEASIFTSLGNGDDNFERWEGVEYLGLMGSAKTLSARIYQGMLDNCPLSDPDYTGLPSVPAACYRARFFDDALFAANIGPSMPYLAREFLSLSPAVRGHFMLNLEGGARLDGVSELPIGSGDSESFVMILSYVENMMMRFDKARTGTLTVQEALAAYPVVCHKLLLMSPFTDDCDHPGWSDLEALFGYLLTRGYAPATPGPGLWDKISAGVNWYVWSMQWGLIRNGIDTPGTPPPYRIGRERIMSIIGALAARSSSSK